MRKTMNHSSLRVVAIAVLAAFALVGTVTGQATGQATGGSADSQAALAKSSPPGGGGAPTSPYFQIQMGISLDQSPVGVASFPVPAGKRLVIEYVSASGVVPAGQSLIYSVSTGSVEHLIPVTQQAPDAYAVICVAGQQTRLYAEPGSTVVLGVQRTGFGGSASANISISGTLMDP